MKHLSDLKRHSESTLIKSRLRIQNIPLRLQKECVQVTQTSELSVVKSTTYETNIEEYAWNGGWNLNGLPSL